jgi:hypothetical protein
MNDPRDPATDSERLDAALATVIAARPGQLGSPLRSWPGRGAPASASRYPGPRADGAGLALAPPAGAVRREGKE